MVFKTISSVIIQYSPPFVNGLGENPFGNFFTGREAYFFERSVVDITVLITLWIMCKTLLLEGLPQVTEGL